MKKKSTPIQQNSGEVDEQASLVSVKAVSHLPNGALRSSGMTQMSISHPLRMGAKLRDEAFIQYPLLPQAIYVFQQIVSAREWALGGPPDAVFKGLDFISNARSKNRRTGLVDVGFEGYLKRRVLDSQLMGITAFALQTYSGEETLNYIDPVGLVLNRKKKSSSNKGYVLPITPKEKCWIYDAQKFAAEDMVVNHILPVGSDNYVAPVAPIIPTANLAWLVREHNSAAIDGRKIRDILMVSNASTKSAIEEALIRLSKLWAGADVSTVGIPVIELTNMSGQAIKDMFAMVGISNIPDSFDQEKFMFNYANQISGMFGVALRHFWNDERNTNRALEEVQEARQQQKGPSAFIRSEQRMINSSGFLKRVTGEDVRFGFIEESDLASLKGKAEILKAYGEAALSFQTLFQQTLTLDSFMSWMKRIGAVPLDIELTGEMADPEEINADSGSDSLKPGETGATGEPEVVAMAKNLKHGQVIVNQDGYVIEKRVPTFSLYRIDDIISQRAKDVIAAAEKKVKEAFEEMDKYLSDEEPEEEVEGKIKYAMDYVEHMMAVENIHMLYDKVKSTHSDWKDIGILNRKAEFSLQFSAEEVKFIDKMCEEHGISVIDKAVGDAVV